MKNKILMIGRNPKICAMIKHMLPAAFMECDIMAGFDEAFEPFLCRPYSIVILDATEWTDHTLRQIKVFRFAKALPIIVLYDHKRPEDRVALLKAGATSCIDSKLDFQECTAQVEALIKVHGTKEYSRCKKALVFGDALVIDPDYRAVLLNGELLKLSRLEFDLLYFLAGNERRVFSREELYTKVWGEHRYYISDDPVKSCIKALRKKLKTDYHEYIQTEWGVGYKFVRQPEESPEVGVE